MTGRRRLACTPGLTALILTGVFGLTPARASAPCRYVVSGGAASDRTVYDVVTKLTWQQTLPRTVYTWPLATAYCQSLSYGGFSSGWRLPTTKELFSLVDITAPAPTLDPQFFPATPSSSFWTSTPAYFDTDARVVDFSAGAVGNLGQGGAGSVRCVR